MSETAAKIFGKVQTPSGSSETRGKGLSRKARNRAAAGLLLAAAKLAACTPASPQPTEQPVTPPPTDTAPETKPTSTATAVAQLPPTAEATVAAPEATATPMPSNQPSMFEGLNYGSYGTQDGAPVYVGAVSGEDIESSISGYTVPTVDGSHESRVNTLYNPKFPESPAGFGIETNFLASYFSAEPEKDGVTRGILPNGQIVEQRGLLWVTTDAEGKELVMNPFVMNKQGQPFGYPVLLESADGTLHMALVDQNGALIEGQTPRPAFRTAGEEAAANGFKGDADTVQSVSVDSHGLMHVTDTNGQLLQEIDFTGQNEVPANLTQEALGEYAKTYGIEAGSVVTATEFHTGVNGPFRVLVDSKNHIPLLIATENEGQKEWQVATLQNLAEQRGMDFGALLNLNRDFRDKTTENFGLGNAYVSWELVQPEKGVWVWDDPGYNVTTAHTAGMDVMANLIWGNNIAEWAKNDPDLHAVMVDYITQVMTHYKGEIRTWSVYNEATLHGNDDIFWNNLGGMQAVRDAFATARAVDPEATLLYNDFVDVDNTIPGDRMPTIEAVIQAVQADGNLDGVALQVIARTKSFDPNKLRTALATLQQYNVPIRIPEFSVLINGENTPENLAEQARVAAEMIQIFREFGVESVTAFPLEDRIANMIYLENSNSGLWMKNEDGSYTMKPVVWEMKKALAEDQ